MIGLEGPEDPKERGGRFAGMARVIGRLYREEGDAWRRHYRKYFKRAARALGLGFVAGFIYFVLRPTQEQRAVAFVVKSLKDIAPLHGSRFTLAVTLFYHNARASVVAILAGVVPFLFLPIVDPFMNGAVLGLLSSVSKHHGLNVPLLIVTQILPHGVFELTAVLYATSVGLYLSAAMGRKAVAAWRRRKNRKRGPDKDPNATGFLEAYPAMPEEVDENLAGNVIRAFALVVLPLLLVAAFIESFITPLLG